MRTSTIRYNPNESVGKTSDYSIPEYLPKTSEGSSGDQEIKGPTTKEISYQDVKPLAVIPVLKPFEGRSILLQRWEGQVVEVRDSEFDAIIIDKTNPENADELVTIEKSKISKDDLPLLEKGSVFYWSIRYSDFPGKPRRKLPEIRFRRLKGWTKIEIEKSKKIGEQLAEFFKSNSECSTERQ